MEKNKIKVLISGCNEEAAGLACRIIAESEDMEVIAGLDDSAREFPEFPVFELLGDLEDFVKENVRPDVIIEFFPHPNCTIDVLREFAAPYQIPIVIATSGFSKKQILQIKEYSAIIPIFASSDMEHNLSAESAVDAARFIFLKSQGSRPYLFTSFE